MSAVKPVVDNLSRVKIIGWATPFGAGLTEYGESLYSLDYCAECERDSCPECGSPLCDNAPGSYPPGPCEDGK